MAPATRKAHGASTGGQCRAARHGAVRSAGPRGGARRVGEFPQFPQAICQSGPRSPAWRMLSPAASSSAGCSLDSAASDAEENTGTSSVAEQAIVMGEFDVFGFVERRLSGGGHLSILSRECRQGYATTLRMGVKRQGASTSRIILAPRHRGRGRARGVGRTP